MISLIHLLYPGDGATCLVANLVVQIAAAVLVAALVGGTLLRHRPAARHAVWLACLGFVLVCPLTAFSSARHGMFSLPPLPSGEGQGVRVVSLTPAPQPAARPDDRDEALPAARRRGVPPKHSSGETPLLRDLPDPAAQPRGKRAAAQPVAAAEPKLGTAPRKVAAAKPFDFRVLVAAAVGIWAAGVLFLTIRLLHGILAVGKLRRTSTPLDPSALGDVLADVRRSLGLAGLPPIGLSERIATPVVAGLFRPAVLLPASLAAAIGQGRIRDVLLHECAHVARRDPWVVVLQRLVAVVYWPHPLIHFLNRQLARCREEVCDNWVLRAVRPADYADTLLEVALHCRDHFGVDMPIGLFDVHGKVEDRVRRLLDRRRDGGVRLPARARWGVLAAGAIFVAVAASFPLVAPAQTEKKPPAEQAVKQTAASGPAAPTPKQPAPADNDQTYVEGITVDSGGKPLASVQVVSRIGRLTHTAVSGRDGRFRLAVPKDLFQTPALLAESQDHSLIGYSEHKTPAMVYADAESKARKNEVVRIVLKPVRTVRVKVATDDEKPAAGVVVQALGETLAFPDSQTDRGGQAAIRVPPDADVLWVIAWKDNLGFDYYENYHDSFRRQRAVPAGPLPATVELRLHKAGRVRVRTIDSTDRPVAGATVVVRMVQLPGKLSYVSLNGSVVAGRSDASGNCEFAWLPADATTPATTPITFSVFKPGYFPSFKPDFGRSDQPRRGAAQPQVPVILRLVKNSEVSGTVRFPDGKPAAGITVRGTFRQPHGYVNVGATTDADGHYRMGIFPRQSMVIAVSDRDWAAASHTGVQLDEGKTRDHLDFVLSRGTRIHGRITLGRFTLGGTPAGDQVVSLFELGERPEEDAGKFSQLEGYRQLLARVDDKGNYEFRVGPGRFKLSMPGSTADGGRIEVKVAGQPELVYDDISAWPAKMLVNGRVVRAADGKPVAGAIVYSNLIGRSRAEPQEFPRDAHADAQGRFSMSRMSDTEKLGFYVRAPEADLAGVAIFSSSIVSSSASEVKIELRPAATVVGRVYDAQGKPAAGEQVTASLGISPVGLQSTNVGAVTDRSGCYRVPCLAVGSVCRVGPARERLGDLGVNVPLDRPGEISAPDLALPAEGAAAAPEAGQLHTLRPPPSATTSETRKGPAARLMLSGTRTLTGVVAAPDGTPLADVLVQSYAQFGHFHETQTDKAGRFRVTVPLAGEAVLLVLPKEYAPIALIVEPQQADLGMLTLKKGVSLSGTVLDADGKPVAGQWLCVQMVRDRAFRHSSFPLEAPPLDRYARSDAAGKVTFDPLPPGDYLVGPSEYDRWRPGGHNRMTPIQGVYYIIKAKIEDDAARPFELKAVHTVKIVAQFYGSDGRKIDGGDGKKTNRDEIECVGGTPGGVAEDWQARGVGSGGRFEVLAPRGMENATLMPVPMSDKLSSFRFRKSAGAPLQAGRELKLGTLTGDLTDIRIIRYVAPVLLVKASDRAAKPIAFADVTVRYDDAALNDRPRPVYFETLRDGRYRSSSLLPDEKCTVTVTADGYRPQSRGGLSLAEGTTTQLDLVLEPR